MNNNEQSEHWIRLFEKIKQWQHYQEPSVFLVFVDICLSANYADSWYKGHKVKRGELITSVSKICDSTHLSDRTVKLALKALEESGEIKREATNKFTKITINQFNKYQYKVENTYQSTQQGTYQSTQQGTQPTEVKDINVVDNNPPYNPPLDGRLGFEIYGKFKNVFLKPQEMRTLNMEFGESEAASAIEDLSCKLMDGTQKSDAHYATLTYWLANRRKKEKPVNGYKGDATIGKEFFNKM